MNATWGVRPRRSTKGDLHIAGSLCRKPKNYKSKAREEIVSLVKRSRSPTRYWSFYFKERTR